MKHLKYFKYFENAETEETKIDYDFYKSTYIQGENAIVGAYMITKENEKSIEVLNLREIINNISVFTDGAKPYYFTTHKVALPLSQIQILEPVPGKEGFFFIKIPYWLVKKNGEALNIKRYNKETRLNLDYYGKKNVDILKHFKDPDVEKYISITDTDHLSMTHFQNYKRMALNI